MYSNEKGADDEVICFCKDIFCFHVNTIIMTIANNVIITFPRQEKYQNSLSWFSTACYFSSLYLLRVYIPTNLVHDAMLITEQIMETNWNGLREMLIKVYAHTPSLFLWHSLMYAHILTVLLHHMSTMRYNLLTSELKLVITPRFIVYSNKSLNRACVGVTCSTKT